MQINSIYPQIQYSYSRMLQKSIFMCSHFCFILYVYCRAIHVRYAIFGMHLSNLEYKVWMWNEIRKLFKSLSIYRMCKHKSLANPQESRLNDLIPILCHRLQWYDKFFFFAMQWILDLCSISRTLNLKKSLAWETE